MHTVVAIEEQVVLRSKDGGRVAWPAELEPEISEAGEAPLPVEEQRVADAVSRLGAGAMPTDVGEQMVRIKMQIERDAAWSVEAARTVLARVLKWENSPLSFRDDVIATLAAAMLGRLP